MDRIKGAIGWGSSQLDQRTLYLSTLSQRPSCDDPTVEVFEGEHDTRSVVMFEFPTMQAIHAFWNSPDYVPIKKLREGVATINVWAFPGV
jgi:uncharacterized protein (DUF1330 family)